MINEDTTPSFVGIQPRVVRYPFNCSQQVTMRWLLQQISMKVPGGARNCLFQHQPRRELQCTVRSLLAQQSRNNIDSSFEQRRIQFTMGAKINYSRLIYQPAVVQGCLGNLVSRDTVRIIE